MEDRRSRIAIFNLLSSILDHVQSLLNHVSSYELVFAHRHGRVFRVGRAGARSKPQRQRGFEGEMIVEYTFEDIPSGTEVTIACRVQDDLGGEGMKTMKMEVD